MRCSTEKSRCYRYTLDVQRMSRDAIVVHEMLDGGVEMLSLYIRCSTIGDAIVIHWMFNGGVEILPLYMRCSTDESRWSGDAIVIHWMLNGGVKILPLYMRCSTEESRCYRYTLDV
ncbi:hypothetical protein Tco_0484418 [Tanacetum coccineum]